MGATILVTGSSTGFGRLTVETLARQGHTVFAGIRDITGKNQTLRGSPPTVSANACIRRAGRTDPGRIVA
jgi:NAD(P)-dependent dehydrogenase (short-subunit alcohol dehydrogenase family)